MFELDAGSYDKVRPIFAAMSHDLAVQAILDGAIAGRVYVDNRERPQVAITWTKYRIYLAGATDRDKFNRALPALLDQEMIPAARAEGGDQFALHVAPREWMGRVEEVLADKQPMLDWREYYAFRAPRPARQVVVPEGFALRATDAEVLADERLRNRDDLRHEMCSERHSVKEFLQNSFGFCLVHDDLLVSWCLSEYNTGARCEVGVETHEQYRRRGLGTVTASALVQEALRRGMTEVGWHCWASNVPSSALARATGFEKVVEYPVFFGWFDPFENLMSHAWMAMERWKRYEEAPGWVEKAFQLQEPGPRALYFYACALALAGRPGEALSRLREAVDKGFDDRERLATDPRLESLHDRPEWKELVGQE